MLKRAAVAAFLCAPAPLGAEPAKLSGAEISDLVAGATVQIDAPLGYKLPIRYAADGTLSGEARDLAFYLGSPTDTGRWWVKGDQLCHKWARWLDSELQCMRLKKDGRTLHWSAQDGNTGTALITVPAPTRVAAVAPLPAASPAKETEARMFAGVVNARPAPTAPQQEQQTASPDTTPAPVAPAAKPAPATVPASRAAPNPAPPPSRMASVVPNPVPVPSTAKPPTAPARASTPPQQPQHVVANVPENDVLNMRSGPSTDYEVVAELRPGSRGVTITGSCQSGWCPVRHQDASGWVNGSFLAGDDKPTLVAMATRTSSYEAPAHAVTQRPPVTAFRDSPDAPRTCLTPAARALLQTIEAKFGPVKLVSTCRRGATIAGTGRPSRHASGNAIDFNAGGRKGEIVRWLIANHKSGGTMTYAGMDHIHVDVGPHFVSIAGGEQSASWRGNRGSQRTQADDDD